MNWKIQRVNETLGPFLLPLLSVFLSHYLFSLLLPLQIIAADCKRVTVLKYFLEALCGQEEPLLAFKGGKYVSVAPVPDAIGKETGSPEGNQLEDQVLVKNGEDWGLPTEPVVRNLSKPVKPVSQAFVISSNNSMFK